MDGEDAPRDARGRPLLVVVEIVPLLHPPGRLRGPVGDAPMAPRVGRHVAWVVDLVIAVVLQQTIRVELDVWVYGLEPLRRQLAQPLTEHGDVHAAVVGVDSTELAERVAAEGLVAGPLAVEDLGEEIDWPVARVYHDALDLEALCLRTMHALELVANLLDVVALQPDAPLFSELAVGFTLFPSLKLQSRLLHDVSIQPSMPRTGR